MRTVAGAALAAAATVVAVTAWAAGDLLRSATEFLSPAMRAEQNDETLNPAMLWVEEGKRLWTSKAGSSGASCASCHGDAAKTMRGLAARYPAVDRKTGDLLNLELRINRCRTDRQNAPAFDYESQPMLALAAYLALQSRGLPLAVATDGAAANHFKAGEKFWNARQGQLNLACRQCHQDNVGRKLRGDTISSGLGTGYPAYRFAWQTIGSLHRRLNDCQTGVRAEKLAPGSPGHLSLELYLAARANGYALEAPGLRR